MIPVIVSIEEFVDGSRDWQERERYWIALYRASGARLLNHTDGGEGMHNPDATTRINLGNYWRGRKRPAEMIEKQRQKMIGFRHTEEAKQKISESKRGLKLHLTDEQREALRARALGRTASEATRKKMSDAHRGKVFTEAQIEKMRAACKLRPVSPDGIQKMRESKRRQSKDPAIRDQWTSQLGEFAKPVISRDTALMMMDMHDAGHTYMSIARHFGACNGTVRRVCLGLGPYRDLRHCPAGP